MIQRASKYLTLTPCTSLDPHKICGSGISSPSSSYEACPSTKHNPSIYAHLQTLATGSQHLALGVCILCGHHLCPPPTPLQPLGKHALGDLPACQQPRQARCGQCPHHL